MTYIIADIGSNFTTLQEAGFSIEEAAIAGADMAKFQLFSEHDLYGDGSTERKIEPWLPRLAECAKAMGIDFGCTAFSPEGVALVDPYVQIHKVASSCVTHIPFLETIAATRKPVIMSVGACTKEEIATALKTLDSPCVTLLYCAASYPSRMFNPDAITGLRNEFKIPVGYSDHTTDIWGAPVMAARQGAIVIEKHFTALPHFKSADRPHSLVLHEFRRMIDAINRKSVAMEIGPTAEEWEFVKYHKVRKTERGYYRVRK